MTDHLENVRPIPFPARGVVDKGLNLQADEILKVDDRNGNAIGPRETIRTFQHSKGGPAEGVEKIDPPELGRITNVMGHIL